MLKNKINEFKQKYSNSSSTISIKKKLPITQTYFGKFQHTQPNFNNFCNHMQQNRLSKVQSSTKLKRQSYSIPKFAAQQSRPHLQNLLRNKMELKPASSKYDQNMITSKTQQTQVSHSEIDQYQIQNKIMAEDLFKQLTPRDLFFCSDCCQYLFAVEKHLHFPNCEQKIIVESTPKQFRQKIAKHRLKKILELSKYVKVKQKQIQDLFEEIKQNKMSKIYHVKINPQIKFRTVNQIVQAFVYTYEKLLKGSTYQKSTIFGSNLFGCF